MDRQATAFDLILAVETRAARIEAALDASPALSQQWRAEVGVAEAVASIGMEDVRLVETDLLHRIFENGKDGVDARAAEDALGVLRFIRAPGGGSEEPAKIIDRILQIARPARADDQMPSGAELGGIFRHCSGRAPILEAIRAAGSFALMTGGENPLGGRLVFMAAEHLSRGGTGRKSRAEDPLRGLGGRYDASWIAAPALALSYRRFRIWSPGNPAHLRGLLEGMESQLGRELGRLAEIRSWLRDAQTAGQGAHGRSRLRDALDAFAVEPVMGGARLAGRLGITPRGALNILADLVDRGLLVEMTRRRSARIWATPGTAKMLMTATPVDRMVARRSPRGSPSVAEIDPEVSVAGTAAIGARNPEPVARAPDNRALRAEALASMDEAMAAFDQALDEADAILGRLPVARERRRDGQ